jgi:hypothetical protein
MKNVRVLSALLAFVITLSGCAVMQPLPTPTGKPEVTIHSSDTNRIKSLLVTHFASQGFAVVQDTPYSLVFGKAMEGGGGLLYQAALGNAYSSTPQWQLRLSFASASGTTRVFAHISSSMQNAFGQTDQMEMNNGKAAHQTQAVLELVKAEAEAGRGKARR